MCERKEKSSSLSLIQGKFYAPPIGLPFLDIYLMPPWKRWGGIRRAVLSVQTSIEIFLVLLNQCSPNPGLRTHPSIRHSFQNRWPSFLPVILLVLQLTCSYLIATSPTHRPFLFNFLDYCTVFHKSPISVPPLLVVIARKARGETDIRVIQGVPA
jgi:hypothetical protein